jgi:hypothetical protein
LSRVCVHEKTARSTGEDARIKFKPTIHKGQSMPLVSSRRREDSGGRLGTEIGGRRIQNKEKKKKRKKNGGGNQSN